MTDRRHPADRRLRGGPQEIPRPPGTAKGDIAPWASLPPDARRPTLQRVADVLASGPPPNTSPVEALGARASAVLCALYEAPGPDGEPDVFVVLTRRAWHLRSHAGEVSFPGGGAEADDDTLWDTACREAQEEVGLDPDTVTEIGELHHLSTVTSRSFIVPFVGAIDGPPDLRANPNEVDAVLHVPLSELLLPEIYHQEKWGVPGLNRPIHFFELVGDTLWGATAAMLFDLLSRVTGKR